MQSGLKKRVKEFRLARLWTQKQMAAAIGISEGTLIRIERGDSIGDLTRAKVDKYINLTQAVQAGA